MSANSPRSLSFVTHSSKGSTVAFKALSSLMSLFEAAPSSQKAWSDIFSWMEAMVFVFAGRSKKPPEMFECPVKGGDLFLNGLVHGRSTNQVFNFKYGGY